MNILYVSTLLSENLNNQILKELKLTDGQQDQKFHRLLVTGLEANGHNVETISFLNGIKNPPKTFVFTNKTEVSGSVTFHYIKYININVFRHIYTYFQTLILIKKWMKKNKEGVILCEQRYSALKACIHAQRLFGIICYGIVTDLPIYHISSRGLKGLKLLFHKLYNYSRMKNTAKCDGFVLLTKQMNNIINKQNKPFVVIEGFSDIRMSNVNNTLENKYDKKVCHYAGKISEIYGIKMLVNAFLDANIPNSELHIFGGGSYAKELLDVSHKHPNIKYFGFKPNQEIVEDQLKSNLLVNPRFTNYEYTKYSFPSKLMEYMGSGTPLLTTRLAGIPEEYFDYIYITEEETEAGLSRKLKEILNKPLEELHEKGLRAKEFAMNNKNNVIQAKKITDMLEGK